MDKQQARIHAEQWIAAWNERNLDAIMMHYAPSVHFSAPTVISRWNKADGILIGRDALRRHFKRGLELALSLHFELVDVLMGVDGMTIVYRRETSALVVDRANLLIPYWPVGVFLTKRYLSFAHSEYTIDGTHNQYRQLTVLIMSTVNSTVFI